MHRREGLTHHRSALARCRFSRAEHLSRPRTIPQPTRDLGLTPLPSPASPGPPSLPARRLVGFEKVTLRPGERTQVSVRIGVADSNHPFSYVAPTDPGDLANRADGTWTTPDGRYRVHVGGSSADAPLERGVTRCFPGPAAGGGGA
ncbi:fibronectin type III-like domain-contianing protein [Citricoccus sp. CH26A]|uniref:fibronectin type III-like domain-contianing protein n=1 Tax=Citricoccus sp. CH26A TaxID=1045009 RepID=UPI001300C7EE|nr:fibronectin type III-like domain-contianing protein [Citricoccus sp. CH26A]